MAAASARLCVETLFTIYAAPALPAAASAPLCVETRLKIGLILLRLCSRLRVALNDVFVQQVARYGDCALRYCFLCLLFNFI